MHRRAQANDKLAEWRARDIAIVRQGITQVLDKRNERGLGAVRNLRRMADQPVARFDG